MLLIRVPAGIYTPETVLKYGVRAIRLRPRRLHKRKDPRNHIILHKDIDTTEVIDCMYIYV